MHVRIDFTHEVINDLSINTGDDYLVSTVHLRISLDGVPKGEFAIPVKQAVGEPLANAALEIGSPPGYDGPLDYAKFRSCVEQYHRKRVSTAGRATINIGGAGSKQLINVTVTCVDWCEYDVDDANPVGW